MPKREHPFINRDLSWLSFNARVLQEAEDPSVPLLERLRFLGIFSNNRDEFFRVRVANIRRMARFGKKGREILGMDPVVLLERIQQITLTQQKKFDKLYIQLLRELEKHKIFMVDERQLSDSEGAFVRRYFREQVHPHLVPIMIETAPKFPYLKDKSIYLAIRLLQPANGKEKKSKYALLEVPTDVVSRFLVLPASDDRHRIILLEDVIRYCLDDLFPNFDYAVRDAYTIKMTRDAELDIDSDVSKGWMEKIEKSVKQRKKGVPVRMAFDERIPTDLLAFILRKIKLFKQEYLIPGGRYHNFKDFIAFPRVGPKHLFYPVEQPVDHPALSGQRSLFQVIREKDILLNYPYHSFHPIIDLLREASIDPKVTSIHTTLYRAARHSSVVNALINAAKNGKQVTVVVELQARFDEESNIYYANRLQEEGVRVIFGVPGLKVHSKLFLIGRREGGKLVQYAHIGTGNFNEQTARLYCDHSLLTAKKVITREVERLFQFYQDNYKTGHYKHLIVSPFNTRKRFIRMIDDEIENAKKGKEAWMILKMNSLVDKDMIDRLYAASAAGVKVKLIVRGICSLVAGEKGLSENIEAISIVDKFLEHSRIFLFCNGGKERCYIASGDWMYRNLDFRSEVAVPILDPALREQLKHYLQLQLMDNTKARLLDRVQDNKYVRYEGSRKYRAQEEIARWLRLEAESAKSTPAVEEVVRPVKPMPKKKATLRKK
jgi:polyphosphate kinase